ncbi:hypothetical protein NC651_025190 [Populus alba x Populus x berolinensis]|nr:hypothetical protein NC651_025190 [Populus alba x Populus x berolinensis]
MKRKHLHQSKQPCNAHCKHYLLNSLLFSCLFIPDPQQLPKLSEPLNVQAKMGLSKRQIDVRNSTEATICAFDSFEALYGGSWQSMELINQGWGYDSAFCRYRGRTLSDCTCFLRPGIDVCVLSFSERAKSSEEGNSEPASDLVMSLHYGKLCNFERIVWVDTRINSIKRIPHESQCSCQLFVNLYVNQGPLGSERATLSKETEAVGIDQISILQKLDNDPCEADNNRHETQFYPDPTWLLAASIPKQVAFDVRSVQNKIVYQIFGGDDDHCSLKSSNHLNCVTFKVEDETEIGWVRSLPYTTLKWKEEEELHLPLAYLFGAHADASCAEEKPGNDVGVNSPKLEFLEGPPVSRTKTNSRKIKSNVEHQAELGEVESGIDNRRERQKSAVANRIKHQTRLGDAKSGMANRKKHGTQIRESIEFPIRSYSKKGYSVQRKNDFDEDMMFGSGWGGKSSRKKVQRARYQSTHLKRDDSCEPKTYKQTALSAGVYDKLVSSYMTNFDSTIKSKEVPRIIDQWEEFKAKHSSDQKETMEPSLVEDDGESSETEMLWREMELCLASAYIFEDNESRVSTQTTQNSSEYCQHEFKLDEEIGI